MADAHGPSDRFDVQGCAPPRYEPVSYRSAPCNTSISVLLRRVVQTAPA